MPRALTPILAVAIAMLAFAVIGGHLSPRLDLPPIPHRESGR